MKDFWFTVCLNGHWVCVDGATAEDEFDARARVRVRYLAKGYDMVVLHLRN